MNLYELTFVVLVAASLIKQKRNSSYDLSAVDIAMGGVLGAGTPCTFYPMHTITIYSYVFAATRVISALVRYRNDRDFFVVTVAPSPFPTAVFARTVGTITMV